MVLPAGSIFVGYSAPCLQASIRVEPWLKHNMLCALIARAEPVGKGPISTDGTRDSGPAPYTSSFASRTGHTDDVGLAENECDLDGLSHLPLIVAFPCLLPQENLALEDNPFRDYSLLDKAPQRDEQPPCEGYNAHPLEAFAGPPETFVEPLCQGTVRLVS